MKTILIHSTGSNNDKMFDADNRDNLMDPMIYLRDRLRKLGYELKTADNDPIDDCERVIFIDRMSVEPYTGWRGKARKMKARIEGKPLERDLYDECIQAGMYQKLALLLYEGPVVCPKNWEAEFHEMFPLIFTWNDEYIDGSRFIKVHCTVPRVIPQVPDVSFSDKKLLVNISSNKFSKHPLELFSARREAIRYFERTQPEGFDHYGFGWDKPSNILEKIMPSLRQRYPSYQGTAPNKWDVLPYYRFGLSYENIRDVPGYISEKIFDCMRCRCVPVFWGASNVAEYVDKDAFIDRRLFKSNEELEEYLVHMTEKDYNRFQEAMQDYLKSKKFEKFLPQEFSDTLIKGLGLQ